MVRTHRPAVSLIVAMASIMLVFGEAIAGGGIFPSDPSQFGFVLNDSGNVTAVVVLDPNGPVSTGAPATPTGTFGSIAITQQNVTAPFINGTAAATFQVQPDSSLGELRFGCNLARTNLRFVDLAPSVPGLPIGGPAQFSNWLSSAVNAQLFAQLGVTLFDQTTLTVLRIPAITRVISQQCVAFPKPSRTLDDLMLTNLMGNIKPLPPTYPDLTIPGVTDPTQQWFPGFIVLRVGIGIWAQPNTSTP
jgi:hypothetical protein